MSNNFQQAMGIRIKDLRKQRHYTREQLAERAGISAKFLYEIEKGNRGCSSWVLFGLSKGLNVSADYILKGSTSEKVAGYHAEIAEELMNVLLRYIK